MIDFVLIPTEGPGRGGSRSAITDFRTPEAGLIHDPVRDPVCNALARSAENSRGQVSFPKISPS